MVDPHCPTQLDSTHLENTESPSLDNKMYDHDEWLADMFWQLCDQLSQSNRFGRDSITDHTTALKLYRPQRSRGDLEFPLALAFLSLLPDRHLELFVQQRPEKLNSFQQFGELPVEIRLKTWNFALPTVGHCRQLDSHLRRKGRDGAYIYRRPSLPRFEWPVGLFVNRESRYEALKRYPIVELITPAGETIVERFCMDPSKDILQFDLHNLTANGRKVRGRKTMWELLRKEPVFASSIRILEIRGVTRRWDPLGMDIFGRTLLRQLRGLKEIYLMLPRHRTRLQLAQSDLRFCERAIHGIFAAFKLLEPNRSLPNVYAVDFEHSY